MLWDVMMIGFGLLVGGWRLKEGGVKRKNFSSSILVFMSSSHSKFLHQKSIQDRGPRTDLMYHGPWSLSAATTSYCTTTKIMASSAYLDVRNAIADEGSDARVEVK